MERIREGNIKKGGRNIGNPPEKKPNIKLKGQGVKKESSKKYLLKLLKDSHDLITEWNENTRGYSVLQMLEFSNRMVTHLHDIEEVMREEEE